jgi:signal transduction histidine kinase
MVILYFLLFGFLLYCIAKWRVRQLQKEKVRLENIVQERTAEVVKQKDEIEEKSKNLQTALDELAQAQNELIRQEKMATAGKLTQGLIDRILNPMNYINNFSKLSYGLLKDLKANVEDEEEHMDKENFEDTLDIIDMLDQNLQKVEQHGVNTTRTLKAMEEMLKDRSGGIVEMNLVPVLHQDEEMLSNYFGEDIKQYDIKTSFSVPQESINIKGNPEQLSMTLMSLLGNAVYAVVKKAQREKYAPEIALSVNSNDTQYDIIIRDNGIGIEDTIIDKIFDPFFTTKPTGEAAGVGLYLSREIIQNIGGDISVKSEKDVYTEFTITIPISQN